MWEVGQEICACTFYAHLWLTAIVIAKREELDSPGYDLNGDGMEARLARAAKTAGCGVFPAFYIVLDRDCLPETRTLWSRTLRPWEWAHFALNRAADLAFAFGFSTDGSARIYAVGYIPLNFCIFVALARCRAATMALHRGHTAQLAKTSMSAMAVVFILMVMLYLRYVASPLACPC
jgi:hypothetical protein